MMTLNPRWTGNVYPIDLQLLANGVPITDAAGSSFTWTMVNAQTGATKVAAYGMTILDAPTALVRWTPLGAHVDTGATFLCLVNQTRADGSVRNFPDPMSGPMSLLLQKVLS